MGRFLRCADARTDASGSSHGPHPRASHVDTQLPEHQTEAWCPSRAASVSFPLLVHRLAGKQSKQATSPLLRLGSGDLFLCSPLKLFLVGSPRMSHASAGRDPFREDLFSVAPWKKRLRQINPLVLLRVSSGNKSLQIHGAHHRAQSDGSGPFSVVSASCPSGGPNRRDYTSSHCLKTYRITHEPSLCREQISRLM